MSKETGQSDWPCHLDVKNEWIARGINSNVFRSGEYVYKVYKIGADKVGLFPDENKLLLYKEITNTASSIAESENWVLRLPFPFGEHKLVINPFLELKKCTKCGKMEGIAPFISGKNLTHHFDSILFHGKAIEDQIRNISRQIEDRLNIGGLWLLPINIKRTGGKIIITDLCGDIVDLRIRV